MSKYVHQNSIENLLLIITSKSKFKSKSRTY